MDLTILGWMNDMFVNIVVLSYFLGRYLDLGYHHGFEGLLPERVPKTFILMRLSPRRSYIS